MTNAQGFANDIGTDAKHRRKIAAGLGHLLADTYALYLKPQTVHWNVRGRRTGPCTSCSRSSTWMIVLAHQVAAQLALRRLRAQRTARPAQTLGTPTGPDGGRSL
jgi:hypothetical protein